MPDYTMIHKDIIESLQRYAHQRIPTGAFLEAVLRNDLRDAYVKADMQNRAAIWQIINYRVNELPPSCWGSYEVVQRHLGRK